MQLRTQNQDLCSKTMQEERKTTYHQINATITEDPEILAFILGDVSPLTRAN